MSDSIQPSDKNRFQWKTVTAIGAATWLVTAQLSGCASGGLSGEGEGEGEGGEGERGEGALTQPLYGGEGEGEGSLGGEGEGEGEGSASGEGEGEGEGAATAGADLATDDAAYLTQLGLIRGHLAVGFALYQQGLADLAETHMKHPRAEIYATVVPAFAARGCDGFGEGLTALTNAVVGRVSQAEADQVYTDLTDAIRVCESGADTTNPVIATKVIEDLLRTAGVEYQIGVVDGAMNNLHEYQDAWGFTQVAAAWAKSSAYASNEKAVAVAGQLQAVIDELQGLWPSLNPDGSLEGDAAQLFGAAGRVQVTGLSLQ